MFSNNEEFNYANKQHHEEHTKMKDLSQQSCNKYPNISIVLPS